MYVEEKNSDHSPWFRESVLPLGELGVPGSAAEGTCISGSGLSSLPEKRLGLGVGLLLGEQPSCATGRALGPSPHPWPVHSWSSAIHEFSCCSSPTSKMMSVRSFTWWGGRVQPCGTPEVCAGPLGVERCHSPSAQRCTGCRASRGACTAGPPGCWSKRLVAWALNSRRPRWDTQGSSLMAL